MQDLNWLALAVGFVLTAVMNTIQTLLVDLVPAQGSSVTACVRSLFPGQFQLSLKMLTRAFLQNNFVRCLLGAALVAVINIITDALRPGWTYVLLGGVCVLSAPLLYVSMRIGPGCRARRREAKARPIVNSHN